MDEKTIELLCEKFHTTVDNLIPVYSEYAMTKDIVSGIIALIILIISIIILILMYKRGTAKGYYKDILYAPVGYLLVPIFTGAIAFICIIALCCNIYSYILWSNFPEMRFLDVIANM